MLWQTNCRNIMYWSTNTKSMNNSSWTRKQDATFFASNADADVWSIPSVPFYMFTLKTSDALSFHLDSPVLLHVDAVRHGRRPVVRAAVRVVPARRHAAMADLSRRLPVHVVVR